MPVPSPRNKILPARGNYSDLSANVASILDGEICYAIDQDQFYQNEGGTLVAVGATKAQGVLADSAVQPGDNVSTLTNDAAYITSAGAPVQSVASKTGVVTLVKGDVGLGNVDNTSDANKPISTATQSALDLKADLVGGVIPNSQLPSLAISEYLGTVANQAALLALSGQRGDWAIRTDTGSTWVITTDGGSLISDWTELATPADAVGSVNGFTGTVVLGASDVGAATSAQGTLADSAVQPTDSIDVLSDVDTTTAAPTDGQVLTWVNANSRWEPAASGSQWDDVTGGINYAGGTVGIGRTSPNTSYDLDVVDSVAIGLSNNIYSTTIPRLHLQGAYANQPGTVDDIGGTLKVPYLWEGNYFAVTVNGNYTFSFSYSFASGTAYAFTLEVTHTSGTITWPTSVKWPGDTAPTLTTGKTHLFMFVTDDGGTRWRGSYLVDYTN